MNYKVGKEVLIPNGKPVPDSVTPVYEGDVVIGTIVNGVYFPSSFNGMPHDLLVFLTHNGV